MAVVSISILYRFLLISTEILTFKFLCIVIYKRLIIINDDFFALFLNLVNTIVAFLIGALSTYTQPVLLLKMGYIGLPIDLATESPLRFE